MNPEDMDLNNFVTEEDADGIHYYDASTYPAEKNEIGFEPWEDIEDDDKDDESDYDDEGEKDETVEDTENEDGEEDGGEDVPDDTDAPDEEGENQLENPEEAQNPAETGESAKDAQMATEGAENAEAAAEVAETAQATAAAAEGAEAAGAAVEGAGAVAAAPEIGVIALIVLAVVVVIVIIVIIVMALMGANPDSAAGNPASDQPTSATRAQVIAVAKGEIGTCGTGSQQNEGEPQKYTKYTCGLGSPSSGSDWAWCAGFVGYAYGKAGLEFPHTCGANEIYDALDDKQSIDGDVAPQPGDTVHKDHHVGLVYKLEGNTLYTIEGNKTACVDIFKYPNYKHSQWVNFAHPKGLE